MSLDFRVSNDALNSLAHDGWVVVDPFLTADELQPVSEALRDHYPTADEYFASPDTYGWLQRDMFAGLVSFPCNNRPLNQLIFHPAILDVAERVIGRPDFRLLRANYQAKYTGAADYAQPLHYDYGNHTLVVPRDDAGHKVLHGFLYLSEVTADTGATRLVSKSRLPSTRGPWPTHMWPLEDWKAIYALEEAAEGSAGALLLWTSDVFHRGENLVTPGAARFSLGFSFGPPDPWVGFVSWPRCAEDRNMMTFITQASVRERDLLGFPGPGDAYWTESTLLGVAARYPGIDLEPYRTALQDVPDSTDGGVTI